MQGKGFWTKRNTTERKCRVRREKEEEEEEEEKESEKERERNQENFTICSTSANFDFGQFDFGPLAEVELAEVEHLHRDLEMFVDQVSDLSSSKESVFFVSFLFFQTDLSS